MVKFGLFALVILSTLTAFDISKANAKEYKDMQQSLKTDMPIKAGEQASSETGENSQKTANQQENEILIFESYFPEDEEAGKKLDEWWKKKDTGYPDTDIFFELFRNGIRKCTIKYKDNFPMQYIGGNYIWNKDPDDQRAIEIVYYASFSPEYKYYAVYSGLSVANPKSEKVLKRLVDIALEYHQLGRIIWGIKQSKQDDEFIAFLEPYLHSSDAVKREHADIVAKAFRGEIDGDKWEREWNRKQQNERTIREFGDDLPKIKKIFLTGTSEERQEILKFVNKNGITLFHDASFIAALGECAKDRDEKVRRETARILGSNFIWGHSVHPQEAIEILLQLSKDQSQDVRYQAVYFGLSVIADKDEQIIKRLVEIVLNESNNSNFTGRARWGLTRDANKNKDVIKKYLAPYLDIDGKKGELARDIYQEIYNEPFMQTGIQTSAEKKQIEVETRILFVSESFLENLKDANIITDVNCSELLNEQQSDLVLRSAQSHRDAKMLTAPRVTVLDGEDATISVTRDVNCITGYCQSGRFLFATSKPICGTKTAGLILKVKPKLKQNDLILLNTDFNYTNINPRSIKEQKKCHFPIIETVQFKSEVMIPNGQTLILVGNKMIEKFDCKKGEAKFNYIMVLIKAKKTNSPAMQTANYKVNCNDLK